MLAGSTFTLGDIGFESISAIALQVWGLPQNVLELPEMYPLVISSILFAASGHNLFWSCINPHRDLRLSPSSITKRSYIYFFFLNVSEQSSPYSRVYMGDKGWAAHPTMIILLFINCLPPKVAFELFYPAGSQLSPLHLCSVTTCWPLSPLSQMPTLPPPTPTSNSLFFRVCQLSQLSTPGWVARHILIWRVSKVFSFA